MKVVSVNVGRPREVEWRGDAILTGIFKSPVSGRVVVAGVNVAGDEQADLSVHGGRLKAVYAYPSEHYGWWRSELPGSKFAWGAFGENLTVEGLLESELRVGDRLRIGSAEFAVTQPRMPCYKLNAKFQRADMVKRFAQSGRSGFYLAITRAGDVGAGDAVEVVPASTKAPTIAQMFEDYLGSE